LQGRPPRANDYPPTGHDDYYRHGPENDWTQDQVPRNVRREDTYRNGDTRPPDYERYNNGWSAPRYDDYHDREARPQGYQEYSNHDQPPQRNVKPSWGQPPQPVHRPRSPSRARSPVRSNPLTTTPVARFAVPTYSPGFAAPKARPTSSFSTSSTPSYERETGLPSGFREAGRKSSISGQDARPVTFAGSGYPNGSRDSSTSRPAFVPQTRPPIPIRPPQALAPPEPLGGRHDSSRAPRDLGHRPFSHDDRNFTTNGSSERSRTVEVSSSSNAADAVITQTSPLAKHQDTFIGKSSGTGDASNHTIVSSQDLSAVSNSKPSVEGLRFPQSTESSGPSTTKASATSTSLSRPAHPATTPIQPPTDQPSLANSSTAKPSRNVQTVPSQTLPTSSQPITSSRPTRVVSANGLSVKSSNTTSKPIAVQHWAPSIDAKSMVDALRYSSIQRHNLDTQTYEERVNPILAANLITAGAIRPAEPASDVIKETLKQFQQDLETDAFADRRSRMTLWLTEKEIRLTRKVNKLRQEYLELHREWADLCDALDGMSRMYEPEEPAVAATTGRATRRSNIVGDAVRSDLEMELIIASLGNEELTDPNHLALRNLATIPDMISTTRGRVEYIYDDSNTLVLDPHMFYAPSSSAFLDWSEEEEETFKQQFAAYPKQFGPISEALQHKTPAQCVTFYYLRKKKQIDFKKVLQVYAPGKRKRGGRKPASDKRKGNGLMADIARHDDEVSKGRSSRGRKGRASLLGNVDDTSTPTPEREMAPKQKRRKSGFRSAAVVADTEDLDSLAQSLN
jgi:hypothetical protein